MNNYVVVTAFDSGPLKLEDQLKNRGWKEYGRLGLSPKLSSASEVPYEWFDEWYVFDQPCVPKDIQVFVNSGTFSLGDPQPTISTMYLGSDAGALERLNEGVLELRRRFWHQIERIKPMTYIANGNSFVFVTQDPKLYANVINAFKLL